MQKVGETKLDVFEDLLKSFESASVAREWNNAARGNEYDRNIKHVHQTVERFKKRFTAAT